MKRKTNKINLFASMKTFTRLFQKPHHSFCSGFPSLSLVDFLQCPPLIGCKKICQISTCQRSAFGTISGSKASFGTIFKAIGSYLKAATSSLKLVSKRISNISKSLFSEKEAVLYNKPSHKITAIQPTESTLKTLKRYSSRDTIP